MNGAGYCIWKVSHPPLKWERRRMLDIYKNLTQSLVHNGKWINAHLLLFSSPPLLYLSPLDFCLCKKILSGSSDNSVSPGTKWNLSLSLLYFLSSVPFSSNSIPARLQGDRDASGKELTNQSQQMVIQWTKRWELPFLFFFFLWPLETWENRGKKISPVGSCLIFHNFMFLSFLASLATCQQLTRQS